MLQYGTRGSRSARILLVGEAYGADEDIAQKPFVGKSGQELDRMLMEAGIRQDDCYWTNVINARPASNDMTRFFIPTAVAKKLKLSAVRGLYPDEPIVQGLANLEELIAALDPQLIIGFGNYPLWALTENNFHVGNKKVGEQSYRIPTGITSYRGSQLRCRLDGIPFLPTYHPAAVLRNWEWRSDLVHDLRARPKRLWAGGWDEPKREYIIQPSFNTTMEVLTDLVGKAENAPAPLMVSEDIETVGEHLECLGLAWSKHHAICIPFIASDRNDNNYWSAEEEFRVVQTLKTLTEHPNVSICGQNFLYDSQHIFYWHRTRPRYAHDTQLGYLTVYPGLPADLVRLSSLFCEYHAYWKDDGKEASAKHDDTQRWTYNCRDCVTTYEIMEALWELIEHFGLELQYAIQMARVNAALTMMFRGVRRDKVKLATEATIYQEQLNTMETRLEALVPESFFPVAKKGAAAWYRSPQALAQLFYTTLGQKPIFDRKTGQVTMNDEALKELPIREPILRHLTIPLQEYRSQVAFGQFITMRPSHDGRIRASFSPTAETFRYRSSRDAFRHGRNLQNIPKGAED